MNDNRLGMPIIRETPAMAAALKKHRSHFDIENRFTYHAPKPEQVERYSSIRTAVKELAFLLDNHCPDSRELSTAMTKLDEVMFFASAAIARNEQ